MSAQTLSDLHPKLKELASHFGVELSERSCEGGESYDGKTIALNGKNGYLGDHRIMHEIAHYVVAKRNQKNKPEYNLGTVSNSWVGTRGKHFRKVKGGKEESQTQEYMCHFLCILWGRAYGISVDLPDDPHWEVKDWDGYLNFKIKESQAIFSDCDNQWRALIRLRVRGMLKRLPLPIA
jgi:hypothetical protein